MKAKQLSSLLRCNILVQMLAVGSLAIGTSVGMVAPAQAVSLSGGQVVFTGATSNFDDLQKSMVGNSFDVTFNPLNSNALVSSASTPFAPTFFDQNNGNVTGAGSYKITASTGKFSYVSGTDAFYKYALGNIGDNLDFAFANGVTLTIAGGSLFTGSKFTDRDGSVALDFVAQDPAGSFYTESGVKTSLNALSFTINDISSGTTGGYSILASTVEPVTASVPEPVTIVGTMFGGTAAIRIRKKLTDAAKK